MIKSAYMSLKGNWKSAGQLEYALYLIFLASLAFSLRAFTSISIGLLLIFNFYFNRKKEGRWLPPGPGFYLLAGFGLYLLLECLSLLHTEDTAAGFRHLEKTSGLLLITLALYSSAQFLNRNFYERLMWSFAFFLFAACTICLWQAAISYFQKGQTSVFFYHELAGNIGQHAIRFSIILYLSIIFLIMQFRKNEGTRKQIIIILVLFFSFFLVLLSSKLVLVFYALSIGFLLIRTRTKILRRFLPFIGLLLAGGLAIALTSNPVSQRFRLLFSGDQHLFQREKFDQGIYFNGVQFRLLQWRIVPEVLNRHQAWMIGVSPGDAQTELDQVYREKNMYTGRKGTEDKGLLGYHTHNQFLQTLLQHGLIGLALLLTICFYMGRMIIRSGDMESRLLVVLLFQYCFTDAILETQYGIVLFCFFPLFSFLSNKPHKVKSTMKRGNPLYQSAFLP